MNKLWYKDVIIYDPNWFDSVHERFSYMRKLQRDIQRLSGMEALELREPMRINIETLIRIWEATKKKVNK